MTSFSGLECLKEFWIIQEKNSAKTCSNNYQNYIVSRESEIKKGEIKRYRHHIMRKEHFNMQEYTKTQISILMWKEAKKDRISGGTNSKSYRISRRTSKRIRTGSKKRHWISERIR